MKCITKNIILDYLNGELSLRKEKLITNHLSQCPYCRREVEEWKKVLNFTEQYVIYDIKTNPIPPHAHITQRFEHLPKPEHATIWSVSWTKPVFVTAAVLVAALMIFFIPQHSIQPAQTDYYVIDNVTYSEKVSLDDLYLGDLESMYLQEICENEELTDDILYGDWQYYEEVLDNLDQEELEELINNLYDTSVT